MKHKWYINVSDPSALHGIIKYSDFLFNLMPPYDKLVRDRIPEIIESNGRSCDTRIVFGDEFYTYLDRKLDEEVSEFRHDRDLEELADIMEVIYGLAECLGHTEQELNTLRSKKKEERGGFSRGIVLTNTTD